MAMRNKSIVLLILFFFILIGGNDHVVVCESLPREKYNDDNMESSKQCPHSKPTNFNYEIILALSTFPPHGSCTDKEEMEISSILEDTVNTELGALPGTIKTKNKVCDRTVNQYHHRRLLLSSNQHPIDYESRPLNNRTFMTIDEPSRSFLRSPRRVLYRRRSYIYVGGGKCRYCLKDNFDQRALLLSGSKKKQKKHENQSKRKEEENVRNFMFSSKRNAHPFPNRAPGISLCYSRKSLDRSSFQWTNQKRTSFFDKTCKTTRENLLGPYVAGDRFGAQLDTPSRHALHVDTHLGKPHSTTITKESLKEGNINFWLWTFDLPPTVSGTKMLADDPFYLLINGIKLDFNLLLAQPGVQRKRTTLYEEMSGNSSAGIKWHIISHEGDFAFGPEPDRMHHFQITVPLALLLQLNLHFTMKPNAKAQRYMFQNLDISTCAGMETNGPFRQGINRLLRMDSAHEDKHCSLFEKMTPRRCRYCLNDRRASFKTPIQMRKQRQLAPASRRDLMYLYTTTSKPDTPLPEISDISLCDKTHQSILMLEYKGIKKTVFKDFVEWTNPRVLSSFKDKHTGRFWGFDKLGPYRAGDSLGVQINSMEGLMRRHIENLKNKHEEHRLRKEPVKEGRFTFRLVAFDLPPEYSTGILADDPLYLFINGIKLDFNLLISQQAQFGNHDQGMKLNGDSFAGIRWSIKVERDEDFAYGSQIDRQYYVSITAPNLVFAHKNQLDIDFIFKPNAKANQYAIGKQDFTFLTAPCKVTGLENSRFQDFQSVVESKLFHKMGVALAREFQGKKGHCLHDKIPVVDVHLVEKKTWKETNPQCNH